MASGTIQTSSKIKLLWTNPSPTANFAAQTVQVGGDCDAVFVVAKTAASSTEYISTFVAQGCKTYIEGFWTYKFARTATLSSSGVEFGKGNGGEFTAAMSENNAYIIPLYIYGVKM